MTTAEAGSPIWDFFEYDSVIWGKPHGSQECKGQTYGRDTQGGLRKLIHPESYCNVEGIMVGITEFQKIGVGLTGFGIFFLLFGVLLYFDSVLLAFGNILFLAGLVFIIGLRRVSHFFFQRHKLRASSFFLGGVALVVFRWPRVGMLVESYGFVLLFKSFFPMAFGFLGTILNIPFLTTLFGASGSSSSMV